MAFATALDGTELWYSVRPGRTSSSTPLVLIQGLALDHRGWDSARHDFADRTTLIFDHRGTGESGDAFTPGWSTRDFATDVCAILDAAGIDRAHVYGHSMGGRIAQWIGAECRQRVVSLVLGATSAGDAKPPPRSAEASQALASGDTGALASLFYPDDWIASHADQVGRAVLSPHSSEAMRAHGAAVETRDGPTVSDIAVPTLIVHGSDDALTDPLNSEALGRRIPDSRVEIVDGARHAFWVGRPEVHRMIAEFLSKNDGRHPREQRRNSAGGR